MLSPSGFLLGMALMQRFKKMPYKRTLLWLTHACSGPTAAQFYFVTLSSVCWRTVAFADFLLLWSYGLVTGVSVVCLFLFLSFALWRRPALERSTRDVFWHHKSLKGGIFVFIFICRGFDFALKGQVVHLSSLCSSHTSDKYIGTFREITSNPLLPTPFPLLSPLLCLHEVHPRFCLSSFCSPILPLISHFSHCSFYFFNCPFFFIAIFLPLPALPLTHTHIESSTKGSMIQ